MAKAYRAYLPEQDLLLPPSLRDWLPENHLAHFVSDVVDQLDLSAIESVYEKEERGQPPYHPRMMTKILLYGYCVGVFSSRQMLQIALQAGTMKLGRVVLYSRRRQANSSLLPSMRRSHAERAGHRSPVDVR